MLVLTVRRAHRTSHLTRGRGHRTPCWDDPLSKVQANSHLHADDQPLVRSSGRCKVRCGFSSIPSSEYKSPSDPLPTSPHLALSDAQSALSAFDRWSPWMISAIASFMDHLTFTSGCAIMLVCLAAVGCSLSARPPAGVSTARQIRDTTRASVRSSRHLRDKSELMVIRSRFSRQTTCAAACKNSQCLCSE